MYVLSLFNCVWLFATLWIMALQASLSKGFSRQEYWSGLPFPSPGDLPHPGIEHAPLRSPALADIFFYHHATWKPMCGKTQDFGLTEIIPLTSPQLAEVSNLCFCLPSFLGTHCREWLQSGGFLDDRYSFLPEFPQGSLLTFCGDGNWWWLLCLLCTDMPGNISFLTIKAVLALEHPGPHLSMISLWCFLMSSQILIWRSCHETSVPGRNILLVWQRVWLEDFLGTSRFWGSQTLNPLRSVAISCLGFCVQVWFMWLFRFFLEYLLLKTSTSFSCTHLKKKERKSCQFTYV